MPKNTLVVIGMVSHKRAYLNVSRDDAIARFCAAEHISALDDAYDVRVLAFDDEFAVYDAWASLDALDEGGQCA